jgi:hypothetical protein
MFTDIRKYMKANQGQAQKMGQAATQKFGQQTGAIGQQLQKKQSELQDRIAKNRARAQSAQQFATQQIQQAGQQMPVQQQPQQPQPAGAPAPEQQAPQFQAPTEQDAARFQALQSGQERFDQVQPLDISKQAVRARTLQNIAENVGRGQGRLNLLKQTFGGQNRYTRGQQSLDAMLLAGDEQARADLTQDVAQLGQQLGEDVTGARRQARMDVGALQQEQKTLQEGIGKQLEEAFTGVREDVTGRAQEYNVGLEQLRKNLAESLGQGQIYEEDLAQLGEAGQEYLRGLSDQYTTLGTERMQDLNQYLQARGLLGQAVEGQDQREFTETELSRIASAQQRARQRALEGLGGISDAERTFLSQEADKVGGALDVGKYTGEDVGLLGDFGSFQTAREAALQDIAGRIGQEAHALDTEYYQHRGQHSGYGYAPARGSRDAKTYAQQAIESAGQFDVGQLQALYGSEVIGDFLSPTEGGLAQTLDAQRALDIMTTEKDKLYSQYGTQKNVRDQLTRLQSTIDANPERYSEEGLATLAEVNPEEKMIREAELAQLEQLQGASDQYDYIHQVGGSGFDPRGAKGFLDSLRARQQAVQALRKGRFGISKRNNEDIS